MARNSVRGRFFGPETVTVFLSELLGTALLVFFGCSSCLIWPGRNQDTLQIVFSFGLAVLISVQIFGCVSGAHINPAVTVAAVIYNLISVQMAIIYVIAQFLGAFLGYGLLMILTPKEILQDSFCVTKPNPLLHPLQAFGIEFIGTMALIWICCGVWDPRNAKSHDSIPLRFGLAVTGIASVTCHFTGGSLNPARSFGPAVFTGDFERHYIYYIAPISGAIVASIIYKYVFRREVIETGSVCCEHKSLHNIAERNAESVA